MGSDTTRRTTSATSRGMALPTALLVLVVLTLLGTAAVFTASTDLDIAGNNRQELRALSITEAGVHEAFARVNMKTGAPPARIIPGDNPPGSGVPDPNWSVRIMNGTPGANEVQTLTGVFGTAPALPVSTTVSYKRESDTEVPSHCNGPCNGDVVRFHTNFGYNGTNVPTGTKVGPPVLQLSSTYSDGTSTSKTLVIDAVRSITQANTPGTVRACGAVNCAGSNTTDATLAPGTVAVVAGTTSAGCGAHVQPPTATIQTGQTCPADLFSATFGMTKQDMKDIADLSGPAPYATPPNGTRGKIIYVTGTAQSTWQSNPVIGTQQEPVIIVFDGDFRVQGNIEIYGIIYVAGNFTIGAGTPRIHGAIVSQGSADVTLTGNSTLQYDPTVLDNLNKLSPYTTILWKPS